MARRTFPSLTTPQRRLRYFGRKSFLAALVVTVVGGLVAADRFGAFGSKDLSDLEKFDGKDFQVVHVVDGDTLDVEVPGPHAMSQRIRLWGVDTPETVKPHIIRPDHFGPEASAFTKRVAQGKTVRLKLETRRTRDKYNRLLAYVYLPDGTMLNRTLVEQGYGYADPRFAHTYKREFESLQTQARRAGRGLWKDLKESDLPDYLRGTLSLDPKATKPSAARRPSARSPASAPAKSPG